MKGQGSQTAMLFKSIFSGPLFFGYSAEQTEGLMYTIQACVLYNEME